VLFNELVSIFEKEESSEESVIKERGYEVIE